MDRNKEEVLQDEQQFAQSADSEQQEMKADNQVEADSAQTEDQGAEPGTADAAIQAELDKARETIEELNQRNLRTQADYDNFRRRTRQEKEDFAKYASMKVMEQIVPILDNFERAITASKENSDFDSFAKGVDMIFRQMAQVLEQEGLQQMQAVGQPFNPEFHQAIMQVESEEYEEGIVVEEVQKGYMLKDKVLRPAMVKVSM